MEVMQLKAVVWGELVMVDPEAEVMEAAAVEVRLRAPLLARAKAV